MQNSTIPTINAKSSLCSKNIYTKFTKRFSCRFTVRSCLSDHCNWSYLKKWQDFVGAIITTCLTWMLSYHRERGLKQICFIPCLLSLSFSSLSLPLSLSLSIYIYIYIFIYIYIYIYIVGYRKFLPTLDFNNFGMCKKVSSFFLRPC